ncbi:MAG: hypothetical protein JJU46_10700 [Balneolaceae bacterium]|nr:hypothetical protein [Balneolaceae bacterium]MCH8548607.1 hypothetical protein [Balneolaceae bacterium]
MGRIYNEDEIAKLLKRAAELEAERSVKGGSTLKQGLSLEELATIAADSGIDPELVARAAKEHESGSIDTPSDPIMEINSDEISCERWIEASPGKRVLDDLILELNHKFNTSDEDVTWWDKLWDDYSGKAKVRKTSSSVEWVHSDEHGSFTHRVLFQKRGVRFRIRVSKTVLWGFKWYGKSEINLFALPALLILTIGGAFAVNFTIFSSFFGALAGITAFAILYPSAIKISRWYLNKHQKMVVDLTEKLTEQTLQLIHDSKRNEQKDEGTKEIPIDIIEISSDSEDKDRENRTIKNNLRERSR